MEHVTFDEFFDFVKNEDANWYIPGLKEYFEGLNQDEIYIQDNFLGKLVYQFNKFENNLKEAVFDKFICYRKMKDEKEIRIFYVPSEKKLLGEKHFFEKGNKERSYYNLEFNKFETEKIIENIILGPNFQKEKVQCIKEFLKKNKFEYVNVYSYEEAYRETLKKKIILGFS